MGSVVRYRCSGCGFVSDALRVGWGHAGRAAYWGAVGICPACQDIGVVDLSERRVGKTGRVESERRCSRCEGPVTVAEGLSVAIRCPRCGQTLEQESLGLWS